MSQRAVGHSDRHAVAAFTHLRPGRLRVKLQQANIPAHHRVEGTEREIDLGAGQSGEIAMHVISQPLTINFVDRGSIP